MSTGLLLVQLGSPASLNISDIETYLHRYLGDWHTMGKKSIFWQLLLKYIILPKAKYTSYGKYSRMFTRNNFTEMPLVTYSREFLAAVRKEFANSEAVKQNRITNYSSISLAYQFGCKPSIEETLKQFEEEGIDTVHVLPLYPQRAGVTTQSAIDSVLECAKKIQFKGNILVANGFCQNPAWVREVAKTISEQIEPEDTLVISCHSIQSWRVKNGRDPYQIDCEQSVRDISAMLREFAGDKYQGEALTVYQSRYRSGKVPSRKWLGPSLVETVQHLGAQKKPIIVVTPVFTADNLETISEVDDEIAEVYYKAGGPRLKRVPCLDARPSWIKAFVEEILPAAKFN